MDEHEISFKQKIQNSFRDILKEAIKRFFKVFFDLLKTYKVAVLIGTGVASAAVLAGTSVGIYYAVTSMSKILNLYCK